MKKVYQPLLFVGLFLLLFTQSAAAQQAADWSNKYVPQKAFIENKGQFRVNVASGFDSCVKYAYDGQGQDFYFTPSGVVFELTDIKKDKHKENEAREMKKRSKSGMTAEEHAEMEKEERCVSMTRDQLSAQWIGANPNVQIVAEGVRSAYYSYSFKNEKGVMVHESHIAEYQKLTYKDMYPNIDVVYEMHPDAGVKYSVMVHPGGDISKVKLAYSKNARLSANGDIKTASHFGNFIDHAPVTFYEDDRSPISSSYMLRNNVISFAVASHDASRTVVIDPWTQTPTFNTSWHCIWECQKDASNNVYVIGGVMPMQLIKYNSAGTLQWTYNTPFDTANYWLGTFAVDNAGNSFVTGGTPAEMERLDPTGTVQWYNTSMFGLVNAAELWSISFNCDQTQLVVGGTGGTLAPYIYNIDPSSGSVMTSKQVTGPGALLAFPPTTQEVRSITACGNGNYYYLTHDSIGYIHQGLTSCLPPGSIYPFHVSSGYGFGYQCDNWRANNTGIRAMRSFGGFVYTHRGNEIHKRAFGSGAIVAIATIPGGGFGSSLGRGYVTNSGVDIDSCGNVYVGSSNGVVKYDANLNQVGTFPTAFSVYDVVVSPNGAVIAAGSTGTSTSGARTGYVQSFAANACHTIAIVCCDANICPHGQPCIGDPPFNLSATTPGGVWSGTGITNPATGTFNPALAGVGAFMIYYTLPCGKDSTVINVNSCTSVAVCRNTNGTLTISGGTAPYTWYKWDSIGRVCQGGIPIGSFCVGGTWVAVRGWTVFATGATVTVPAGADTIKVLDNAGTADTIYNISILPLCNPCHLTISNMTHTDPSCGANNGTAGAVAATGTLPYQFRWSNGDSTQAITGLAAGRYIVTVTDSAGCRAVDSVTIAASAAISVTVASKRDVGCRGDSTGTIHLSASGGTGPYTYTWSPAVSTRDSAVHLAAGSYAVTAHDANNCTATISITIGQPLSALSVSTTTTQANCGVSNGTVTATASGGTGSVTFQWSAGTSTTAIDSNLSAGTYIVTVTDSAQCRAVDTANISNIGAPTVSISNQKNVSCYGGSDGKIVLAVSGGNQPYAYTWSPNVSTVDSAVNLTARSYTVSVSDASGCIVIVPATITQPPLLSQTIRTNNADCGLSNGWIKVDINSTATPYTLIWSVAQFGDSIYGLSGGTYYLTVTDSGGCQTLDTISVGTNNGPLAPTITAGGPLSFCQGGSVVLTSSAATGNVWSNAATTQSINVISSGTYTVTQTVGGCTSPPSAAVVVTINPVPAAPNISASGPLSFCQGDSVILTSSVTSGNLWSDNESTQSIIVRSAGSYTVRDTSGGCPGAPSAAIVVTIVPGPTPSVRASRLSICPDSIVSLDATTASATAYLWSTGSTSPIITVNSPATYTVTVTVNGCNGTDAITIGTDPLLGPLSLPSVFNICIGDSVTLDATTLHASAYIWSPIGAVTPALTVAAQGIYTVTVSNNCGSSTATSSVSFKDCECRIYMPDAFTPNGDGVNDEIGLHYDCPNASYLSLRIFNRWGEKIYETNDLLGQWDGKYRGTAQPSGVYVYSLDFVGMENNKQKTFHLFGSLTLIR